MSTYNAAAMNRDIIYKLDEINSTVTIIKGIVGSQGQAIREIKGQVKLANVHLDEIDIRLEGIKDEIRAIKAQQDIQGQGIREIRHQQDVQGQRFTALEERFTTLEERFTTLEGKFEQVLDLLTRLRDKAE